MSANPNNASSGWAGSSAIDNLPFSEAGRDADRNALQALLAFACIHDQAARRKSLDPDDTTAGAQEEFALNDVLQLVAARALAVTGADGVAIALAEENAIVCRACCGKISPQPGVKVDPTSGFSGACLRGGHTVRCDDAEIDSRVNAQAARTLGARSMVAVPLTAKQRVVGLIEVFSSETFGFNDSDVRSLNLLGELILAAIRPEEEDRLAQLAGEIGSLATYTARPATSSNPPDASSRAPRVIGDEKLKFEPAPAGPESIKAAAPPVPAADSPAADSPAAVPAASSQSTGELGAATLGQSQPSLSISGIALIGGLVLIAVAMGLAVWQKIRHTEQTIRANTRVVTPPGATEKDSRDIALPAPPEEKPENRPQVTGIRHWSSEHSASVVVDLEDQVQYEAHSLDSPARVYFDLFDTKLAPGLLNQSIEVNDTFLKRVRIAQPTEGVTRIVLEVKQAAEFSVRLDPDPYRLTVEVRTPSTNKTASPTTSGSESAENPSPGSASSLNSASAPAPASVSPPQPQATPQPQTTAPPASSSTKPAPSRGFSIVLDAGHGGWDLGTVGRRGLVEKDLVLDVVERLGKLLEDKQGVDVVYTRQDDSYLPLEKRAEIANLARANIFVSVHANYSDLPTARGVETYYTNTYSSLNARTADFTPSPEAVNWTGIDIRAKVTDSHRLASDVQEALYTGLSARTREIRNRGVKKAQYVVLTGTLMPSVLAEISFVSSPEDENKLESSDYRQQIADALYKGVAKFYIEMRQRTDLASNEKPSE